MLISACNSSRFKIVMGKPDISGGKLRVETGLDEAEIGAKKMSGRYLCRVLILRLSRQDRQVLRLITVIFCPF